MSKPRLKVLLEELCWVPLSPPSLYYCFPLSLSLSLLSLTHPQGPDLTHFSLLSSPLFSHLLLLFTRNIYPIKPSKLYPQNSSVFNVVTCDGVELLLFVFC
jgi:hypothetical protein